MTRTWSTNDNFEAEARRARALHHALLRQLDPDYDAPAGRFIRRSRVGQGARFHPRPDKLPLRPIDPVTSEKYLRHDRSRGFYPLWVRQAIRDHDRRF